MIRTVWYMIYAKNMIQLPFLAIQCHITLCKRLHQCPHQRVVLPKTLVAARSLLPSDCPERIPKLHRWRMKNTWRNYIFFFSETTAYYKCDLHLRLTHRGRVPHIYVRKFATVALDNDLSPVRHQDSIWTHSETLLIGPPFRTDFNEILIKILQMS